MRQVVRRDYFGPGTGDQIAKAIRQLDLRKPSAVGTALAQAHLRSVMLGLGMTLLGGEAYITFKPNLFDDQGNIGDETTQKFLQGFVDRFATLVGQLSGKKA